MISSIRIGSCLISKNSIKSLNNSSLMPPIWSTDDFRDGRRGSSLLCGDLAKRSETSSGKSLLELAREQTGLDRIISKPVHASDLGIECSGWKYESKAAMSVLRNFS